MHSSKYYKIKNKGFASAIAFITLAILSLAVSSYINSSTTSVKIASRRTEEIITTHLCEAGIQCVLFNTWKPFKQSQNFVAMESALSSASPANPAGAQEGSVVSDGTTVGWYSAGVIRYERPAGDNYKRFLTLQAVGWTGNSDFRRATSIKTVQVKVLFNLARSELFDYCWFGNNKVWTNGNTEDNLIINGDIGANGDVEFESGDDVHYVNGTVRAVNNEKLLPASAGLIHNTPAKMSTNRYRARLTSYGVDIARRLRQAYEPSVHGTVGSAEFEKWRSIVYNSEPVFSSNKLTGAVMKSVNGTQSWRRENPSDQPEIRLLDSASTREIAMPALNNINVYMEKSRNWRNPKRRYSDGSANPFYNQPAYVEVYNTALQRYERVSTDGVITGSIILIGTQQRPIRIHGPIAIQHDLVIKGYVEGQGTFYTGRNVHVAADLRYKNAPDFRITAAQPTMERIEERNERKDFLGLAAGRSVIFGNPRLMWEGELRDYFEYATRPPLTLPRLDEQGNRVPAWDAKEVDEYGIMRSNSLFDLVDRNIMENLCSGHVGWVDAIMYANQGVAGQIGVPGRGTVINGTIINRDEAMGPIEAPTIINYDNRILERDVSNEPLIDIELPRSPTMTRSAWQDKGFISSR